MSISDGGAVNNLPVNVARHMGADIVIAVYLDTGKFDKKTLESAGRQSLAGMWGLWFPPMN